MPKPRKGTGDRSKKGPTPKQVKRRSGRLSDDATASLENKRRNDCIRKLATTIAVDDTPNPGGYSGELSDDMITRSYTSQGEPPPYVNRRVRRFASRYGLELPDDKPVSRG